MGLRSRVMAVIGKRNLLSIVRESEPGLYLNGEELGEILLPRRYIPRDVAPKDRLDVFIHLDSEDRLVATTEIPFLMIGEFACLEVLSVNPRIGAFLDWGLPKDLLLPFREQGVHVRPGERVLVGMYLDPKTQRLVATTRWSRHLSREAPAYARGQPVEILIAGRTPLGYNAIVENAHRGLLYHSQLASPLKVGQRMKAFVREIREGGHIDLSLDASGYQRVASLTTQILQALERHGGQLALDDSSSPELIRQQFGVSKKAFKQALGSLYKDRRISFEKPGIRLLEEG